jgi:hypothetical protein
LDPETNDDDEEDEVGEKPKKWRRFFRGAFREVVQPPEGHDTKSKPRPGFDLETWLSWQDKPEPVDRESLPTETIESVAYPQASEASVTTEARSTTNIEGSVPEESNVDVEDVPNRLPTSPTEAIAEPPEAIVAPFVSHAAEYVSADHNVEPPTPAIERSRSAGTPVEREVVIERGVGSALPLAVVGLEYLSRKKADRELNKKFTDRTDTLKKDVTREQLVRSELESLVKQNKEQLEALKTRAEILPTPSMQETSKLPIKEQPAPVKPEKDTAEKVVKKPAIETENTSRVEIAPKKETAAEKIVSKIDQSTTVDKPEIQPRKIMEQVAAAAEHDAPVEIAFERSHEVKDEPSISPGATSIGSIIANQTDEFPKTSSYSTDTTTSNGGAGLTNKHPSITNKGQSQDYKVAIKMGFWTAIIIIVLGSITYLMVK